MAKKVMAEIINNNEPRNPNTIRYLVCIKYTNDLTVWAIVTGREDAFEFIKYSYDYDATIDLDESFILSDTSTLSQMKSLVQFVKYCRDELREPWAQGFEMSEEDNFDEDDFRRPIDPNMFSPEIDNVRQILSSNDYLSHYEKEGDD